MIAFVVAKAANDVIGSSNDLPWYLPADLKHFKELTVGHPVVMGRKTYESIFRRLHGPLPNRRNIVVSASLKTTPNGFELASSLEQALHMTNPNDTTFIIGGASLYKACLNSNSVDLIYLTEIPVDIPGDTFFPKLNSNQWRESSREIHTKDEKNPYDYSFVTLTKVRL